MLTLGLFSPSITVIERVELEPIVIETKDYDKTEIAKYLRHLAKRYDINESLFVAVADCESNLLPSAYNPLDTDGYPKYGLWQFHEPTFYGGLKEYGLEGGIWDWVTQSELAARMWYDGKHVLWGCYFDVLGLR